MKEKDELIKEALAKLSEIDEDDVEMAHIDADDILCDLLVKLGYSVVVEAYTRIPKWFA